MAEVESQLRAVKAARSGSSAPVSRLSLKVGVDDVRRMMYDVCSMLDAATAPGPLSRLPLTAPVPGQVSKFSLRDDVAAAPVRMPSPAADAPVKMLSSAADVPVKVPIPAADAPVKMLSLAADVPVKMLSSAANAPVSIDAPVKMPSSAADAPVMMLNPAADAPVKMPPAAVTVPVLPFDAPAVLHLWRAVPAACPVPNLRDPAADMMTIRARPVSGSPHP